MSHLKRKLIALLIIASMAAGLAGCTVKASRAASFSVKNSELYVGSGATSLHTMSAVPENTVSSSGFTSMSFEPSSAAVCITELTEGNVWSVLPLFENGAASAFDVVLRNSDGVYRLNSQDNSVAFGSYEYEIKENGVSVEYLIADRVENSSGSVSAVRDGAALKITVEYVLTDGDLRVSVDCADIELSPDTVLQSISLMPYFGAAGGDVTASEAILGKDMLASAQANAGMAAVTEASAESAETAENGTQNGEAENGGGEETETQSAESEDGSRDFLLVPDGCGAVMYTDTADENTAELSFDVYGEGDDAAAIPVFGIKKGSGAFVAIIDDGAAIAEIKARRAENDPFEAAAVYPSFTVTEHSEDGGRYLYAQPYDGVISVCYRFMSGSEANYISMAAVCREELIRNGTLSSKTVGSDEYPLNVSVTVSVDGTSKRTVSTFEDVEDLLLLLKSKGVENVEVILNGMFSGGLVTDGDGELRVLRSAGGTSGLQKLCDYADMQKFKVYAGVTLIKSGGVKSGRAATALSGKELSSSVKNMLAPDIGEAFYPAKLIASSDIEKKTVALMSNAERLPAAGLCILDGDLGTYSDASGGENSDTVSHKIAKNVSAFSTRKELAVSGVSFNMIKNASLVTDVPLVTSKAQSDAYRAVPLIPAVLHSTVRYAGTPVNSGTAAQLSLLKCVEYGAQPQYLWVFDESSHYFCAQTFNEAVDFVLRASEELGDLSSCRITEHGEVEDGVFFTGYDNGAFVYVNYNNYSVNIGDIAVLPYDYIRIN